jgi:probable phosphoglycerate mutase
VTTLLLARHGETDWNRELRIQGHSDVELNDEGRAQARALAEELAGVALAAVYSSDLSRARETAEIVAAGRGLPVQVDPDLREREYGSWEGLTRAEIERRFGSHARHDGESDEAVRGRMVGAVSRIVAANPGARVLVVSHGGALNALWHHAFGARRGRWPNCAVYNLAFRDGAFVEID